MLKELYPVSTDFGKIYFQCELEATNRFLGIIDFYLNIKDYVFNCSIYKLLVREAHGGLMGGYFWITKTLEVLHKYFY